MIFIWYLYSDSLMVKHAFDKCEIVVQFYFGTNWEYILMVSSIGRALAF